MNKENIIKFPCFEDRDGNRFIYPGLYEYDGETVSWMKCRYICAAIGVKQVDDFETEVDENGMMNFPRLVADSRSPGYAHGGSQVFLIGGPVFEEALEKGD